MPAPPELDFDNLIEKTPQKPNGLGKYVLSFVLAGLALAAVSGVFAFLGSGRANNVYHSPEAIAQERMERVAGDSVNASNLAVADRERGQIVANQLTIIDQNKKIYKAVTGRTLKDPPVSVDPPTDTMKTILIPLTPGGGK